MTDLLNEFFYDLRRVIPGVIFLILYYHSKLAEGFTQPPPARYPVVIFAAFVLALGWFIGVVIENVGYIMIWLLARWPAKFAKWRKQQSLAESDKQQPPIKIDKPVDWVKWTDRFGKLDRWLLPKEAVNLDFKSPMYRLHQKHIAEKVMFRSISLLSAFAFFFKPNLPGWSRWYALCGVLFAGAFWWHLKKEIKEPVKASIEPTAGPLP